MSLQAIYLQGNIWNRPPWHG